MTRLIPSAFVKEGHPFLHNCMTVETELNVTPPMMLWQSMTVSLTRSNLQVTKLFTIFRDVRIIDFITIFVVSVILRCRQIVTWWWWWSLLYNKRSRFHLPPEVSPPTWNKKVGNPPTFINWRHRCCHDDHKVCLSNHPISERYLNTRQRVPRGNDTRTYYFKTLYLYNSSFSSLAK